MLPLQADSALRVAADDGDARTVAARVTRVERGTATERLDHLAAEAPLEIRIDGETACVTLRTPGDDAHLALGWMLGDGWIRHAGDIAALTASPRTGGVVGEAVVDVRRAPGAPPRPRVRREVVTGACGACGAQSAADIRMPPHAAPAPTPVVAAGLLSSLPERMRAAQAAFEATGGLHAAAVFGYDGELLNHAEDIGRHNAVDKAVGGLLAAGMRPPFDGILVVSGRAGFDIVQKAGWCGVPIVVSVSAASSLAVSVAERAGITLAGFVRGETMNVYTHAARLGLTGHA